MADTQVKHPTTEDLVKTDSDYSSMRWAFMLMVKVGIFLSFLSVAGMIVCAILDKQFPTAGVTAVLGILFTTAFGGKSVQSFAENRKPGTDPNLPTGA